MASEKHTWNKVYQWAEELHLLESIIAKTALVEMTKWGAPVYTIDGKNVVGIGGFKNYFTIWFFNGVFLKDEKKVLVNAQEGVTKALRQWRFNSKAEVDEKMVLAYITEAIENERLGKKITPEKKKTIISGLIQSELELHPELNTAFLKLSPYKQRDYIEYVETAKRHETKLARMEKIKPMILLGIGLNDKYK